MPTATKRTTLTSPHKQQKTKTQKNFSIPIDYQHTFIVKYIMYENTHRKAHKNI